MRGRPSHRRHRLAFTLYELVIVVIIALMIGTIFVLSTRDLYVRAKVMKAREEQSLLARALSNYRVDYRRYPSGERALAQQLVAPTAYVASMPSDPFANDRADPQYLYFASPGGGFGWAIVSPGPDGKLDFRPMEPNADADPRAGASPWDRADRNASSLRRPSDVNGAGTSLPGSYEAALHAAQGANGGGSGQGSSTSAPGGLAASIASANGAAGGDAKTENLGPHPAGKDFRNRDAFKAYLRTITYDPTNGLRSAGDIIATSDR